MDKLFMTKANIKATIGRSLYRWMAFDAKVFSMHVHKKKNFGWAIANLPIYWFDKVFGVLQKSKRERKREGEEEKEGEREQTSECRNIDLMFSVPK